MTVGPTSPSVPVPAPAGGAPGITNYTTGVQSVSSGRGLGTQKVINGAAFDKTSAKNLIKQARIDGTYQNYLGVLQSAGYVTTKNPSIRTVENIWGIYVDDFFMSDYSSFEAFSNRRIAETGGTKSGTTSATSQSFSDGPALLNKGFTDYLGFEFVPTKQELSSFVNELRKLETDRATKQITSRDANGNVVQKTTGGVTDADRETLMLKYIGKRLETQGIKNAGGAISATLNSIRRLASDYGVTLGDTEVRRLAINSVNAKNTTDATAKIQTISKTLFPKLANVIDQGVSLKEYASGFLATKAQMFGLPTESINVFDNDIMSALNNGLDMNTFKVMLRKKPEYQYTPEARETASAFVNNIKRDFGLSA
jgi:hypothetical protein